MSPLMVAVVVLGAFFAAMGLWLFQALIVGRIRRGLVLEDEERRRLDAMDHASEDVIRLLRWKAGLWDELVEGMDGAEGIMKVLERLIKKENDRKRAEGA